MYSGNPTKYTSLIATPLEYGPNQAPFVPQLSSCPSMLFNYVPAISAAVATQVGRNAVENPHAGRVFTFNELAVNNWANPSFAQAVATAVDYIALHLHKGVYNNVETAIADCIHRVLAIITSMNIVNNPDMHYCLDHAIINEARRVVSTDAVQIQHEIAQMKLGLAAPNPHQMGMGGGYSFPGAARPIQTNQRVGQYGNHQRQGGQITSQGFQQQGMQPVTASPTPSAVSDRYSYLNRSADTKQQQATENTQQQQQPQAAAELTLKDWTPSSFQQFPPAFDLFREYAVITQHFEPRSSSVVNVIAIKSKEVEMDRNQHSLNPFQTQLQANVGPREKRTAEVLAEQQEKVEKIPTAIVPKIGDVEIADSDYIWKPVTSLKDAIFTTKFERDIERRKNPKLSAHTELLLLTNQYNTLGDMRYVIEFLSKSNSLSELGHNLGLRMMEFEGMDQQSDFVQGLRDYVTNEFNLFLRNRCCVHGINCSDFVEDIGDLPAHLKQHRGDAYVTAMMMFQGEWIEQLFELLDNQSYDQMLSTIVPPVEEDDDPKNYVTATFRGISVSTLDVLDRDLNIGFPIEGYTALVTEESHPTLLRFGRSLMDLSGTEAVCGVSIAHHYIVTSDNVIYELTPSPSAKNDGIIVSKITL